MRPAPFGRIDPNEPDSEGFGPHSARIVDDNAVLIGLESAGIGSWDLDLATRKLVLSPAARALVGVPAGRPADDFDDFLSLLDPEDAAAAGEAAASASRIGTPLDVRCRLAGGGGRWLRLRGAPSQGLADGNARLAGILLDIDEEKRLERTLLIREEHLRSILDTIPDGMIVIDDEGTIQLFSRAAEHLFGHDETAAIGRNVSMVIPLPDRSRHDSYMARYRETGERHIVGIGRIVMGERKDGSTFPMYLSVGEMQSGGRRYFTGFVHDLTEQRQTEARLADLQAELIHVSRLSAMGDMASALAHELNQPLAAISNYITGSRRLLEPHELAHAVKIEVALDKAAEQAIRAGRIIRHLRGFVARGETKKRTESLSRLVEDARALGLIGAREQGVTLRIDLPAECDLVVVDRLQIQQVLVILFRNALEAMQDCSRRELTVSSAPGDEGMTLLSVADTGRGFSEETRSRLFQPFFTTKGTGIGVDLSVSRTIVEAHGGRMWAETNDLGGATFLFSLPSAAGRKSSGDRFDAV
ncbi:sensor histidine kinase [Labrys monachus]|uniref:histidine kinase n=1 Tax=Labrys monachus TaxID=217067 RepID=A0ABU0FAH2_9HYPH|nr:PAS domain-containing sensor histidine kinase [Labrys monachus]MDQ0391053.1 two-component system sensor kinase FixL [Labrys monachus]